MDIDQVIFVRDVSTLGIFKRGIIISWVLEKIILQEYKKMHSLDGPAEFFLRLVCSKASDCTSI